MGLKIESYHSIKFHHRSNSGHKVIMQISSSMSDKINYASSPSQVQPSSSTGQNGPREDFFDILAGIVDFSNQEKSTQRRCKMPPLKDLLDLGASKIMSKEWDKIIPPDCNSPNGTCPLDPPPIKFRWIHVPVNKMDWVEVNNGCSLF
jgi:hypothetical protein